MKKSLIYSFAIALSLSGCFKKEKLAEPRLPNYQPEIGVPLIKARLTVRDFVKEGNDGDISLGTESDGLYFLTYTQRSSSGTGAETVELPNQSFVMPNIPLAETTFPNTFDFDGQGSLTKAELKAGNLALNLTTTNVVENFTVTLTFPTIINPQTNMPFSVSANSGMQPNILLTGSFAGYEIRFKEETTNGFDYVISVTGATLGTLSGTMTMNNLQYRLLKGSFNDIEIGLMSDETNIDIFKDILDGNIRFANPSVEFTIANSFGVPVLINKQYFQTVYSDNSIDEIHAGDFEPSANKIVARAISEGTTTNTVLYINNSNSVDGGGKVALKTALAKSPQKLRYGVNPKLTTQANSFIRDDSKLDVTGTLKLPFHGAMSSYSFQDTSDVGISNLQELDFAEFIIGTENSIPIELNLQVYFVNSNNGYEKLDSMFINNRPLLKSPVVDNSGSVVSPGADKQTVMITQDRLKKLENADKIIIKAGIQTTNSANQDVKIFDHNHLDIRISLHAKANIDLDKE